MGATGETLVYGYGDGIVLSPGEMAAIAGKAAEKAEADVFCQGGAVKQLENEFARQLGKEAAVWLPTGTLANHLALRLLAEKHGGRRVLVPEQAHLYRDCGDCAQTLSGLNLMALGWNRPCYTLEEARTAQTRAVDGPMGDRVAVVHVETPVRRQLGRRVPFVELEALSGWARENRMGTHLDGPLLFVEAAYTGRSVREYAALFDTVYVSMYKCFNAGTGAILAGPMELIGKVPFLRRMFGGATYQAWMNATLALHFLPGFGERMRRAVEASEKVIAALEREAHFGIERVPEGTNVFRLKPINANHSAFQGRLEQAGVVTRLPATNTFVVQVNETWLRVGPEEIVERFRRGIS